MRSLSSVVPHTLKPSSPLDRRPERISRAGHFMLDVLMLVTAGGFFALAAGYCFACERL